MTASQNSPARKLALAPAFHTEVSREATFYLPAIGGVVLSLSVGVLCRPQNTLAHFRGCERKCLTGSRFAARMLFVVRRVMPPEPPP